MNEQQARRRVSLFLKLYGSLLLCITVVALVTWWSLQGINEWRAARYREHMASGMFRLIALGTARHAGAERASWLQGVGQMMEAPFDVVPGRRQGFTWLERRDLRAGNAVVRLDPSASQADIYARIPGEADAYIHTRMSKVSEQQAKALAALLIDELQSVPLAQRQAHLLALKPYFAYQVRLVDARSLGLDGEQKARIANKEVVLVLKQGNTPNSSSVRIIAPLPESQKLIELGPLYLFTWMPMRLMVISSLIALAAITLCAYLLVRPLERRIKQLELVLRRMRAGDLGARAQVRSGDEIGQLAFVFNGMADHIQRLILAQKEMMRAVSHELRTPVARIRFGVEILAEADQHEDRQHQLREIDADIEELNQLIDEILTYARLEEGLPHLRLATFSLPDLLQRVRAETTALRVAVEISVAAPVMEPVWAEERYIHRVVQNLVGNAVRYARHHIRLSCGQDELNCWLSVEDDGPGIPESERQRIFEPFARLDDSRTRSSGGYGLGLSIVEKIAHWHEGSISVGVSADLGGAAFIMRWPRHLTRAPIAGHLGSEPAVLHD